MRPGSLIDWLINGLLYLLQRLHIIRKIIFVVITQQGDIPMSPLQPTLPGLAPGASIIVTASLFDAVGNPVTNPTLLSQITLVWSSTNANVSVSSSGTPGDLTASVAVAPAALQGELSTLKAVFAAPLSDGSNPIGSGIFPVLAPVGPAITQLIITQAA